jgi:RimJ/RimL family protein N-acetyltransferase
MVLVARPIEERDHLLLSSILSDRTLHGNERLEAARRLAMLRTNLKTCYVVEDAERNVRFLQWLVLSSENEKLRLFFGDWYPMLSTDEGLMESVYVFPQYRGTGMLASAVKIILDVAVRSRIKRIVAMIPSWNSNSLKSFMKMGFKVYQVRIERRFFFFHRRRTIPLNSTMDEQVLRMILPPLTANILLKMKPLF